MKKCLCFLFFIILLKQNIFPQIPQHSSAVLKTGGISGKNINGAAVDYPFRNKNNENKLTNIGWETLALIDFDNNFPDVRWSEYADPPATDAFWSYSSVRSHSPSGSKWCAGAGTQPGYDTYQPNMNAWFKGGPFDLSNATDGKLEFWYWNESESGYDYLKWMASVDGTYFYGWQISGNSGGWVHVEFDLKSVYTLGNICGNSSVWIAFIFTSDGTNQHEGAYIDDILLQKLVPDVAQPTITITDAPTSANAGSPITVQASASDLTGINDFYIYYWVGSDTMGTKVNFSGNSAVIQGSAVCAMGLDYRIFAKNNNNVISYSHIYSVSVSVPDGALTTNTVGGTNVTAYRMFSIPMTLFVNSFRSFFSGSNALGSQGTDWRFFELSDSTPVEYNADTNASLQPGQAYFMITRNPRTIVTKSGTTNLFADLENIGIPLSTGWNLVGNPMPYDIKLSDFDLYPPTGDNLLNNSYYWDGSWHNGNLNTLKLKKWEGLAIKASTNTNLILTRFTGLASPSIVPKMPFVNSGHPFCKGNELLKSINQWYVQISANDDVMCDQENYFGVMPDAKTGYDQYDLYEPPILPDAVSLYFVDDYNQSPVNSFSVDVRPPFTNGQTWKAILTCKPLADIKLSFEGIDNLPPDFDAYLIVDNAMVYNLRHESVITIHKVPHECRMKLLVGTEEYLSANRNGISLVPEKYILHQNFPNPFNPSTLIRYELPEAGNVVLEVYSLLGEKVRNLVDKTQDAGYYEILWDGKNNQSIGAASGIYLYRLLSKNVEISQKMLLLH